MNAVVVHEPWDPNSGLPLPAYLTDAATELGSNIPDRMMVPSVSYEGKTWSIHKDGNKTRLEAKNADGDMVPVPIMRCVVLNFNPERGRSYYEGVYNPAAASAPKCWSPDGKAPDPSVREKQAATCTNCPQSVKGSKVTDGKEMIACSSHRMLAVLPAFDLTADPLRLKIAVTSDYDKDVVDHGWYAFKQYSDWLKSRGIAHTGLVVTKIKFDSNVAYPKLLFALDRVLTQDEVGIVKAMMNTGKVADLLTDKWTAAGTAGTPTDDRDIKPWGLEGAYADGWAAHPDAAGYSWKGSVVLANEALALQYPAPVAPEPEPTPPAPVAPPAPAAPAVPAAPAAPEPAPAPIDPLANAEADGWIKHPSAPDYHYKGSEVVLSTDLIARYPAVPTAATPAGPAAPPAPPPAPEPAPVVVDWRVTAAAEGWAVHPTDPAYWWKGSEVVAIADMPAKLGNGAHAGAAPTPATPAAATAADPGASLSEGVVLTPELKGMLDKWVAD